MLQKKIVTIISLKLCHSANRTESEDSIFRLKYILQLDPDEIASCHLDYKFRERTLMPN